MGEAGVCIGPGPIALYACNPCRRELPIVPDVPATNECTLFERVTDRKLAEVAYVWKRVPLSGAAVRP